MTDKHRSLWTRSSVALLEDNRFGSASAGGLLYRDPRGAIEAYDGDDIAQALAAIDAERANGAHCIGFFSYEFGYCIEPRLRPLLPKQRSLPLLSFGLFEPPQSLSPAAVTAFFGSDSYEIAGLTPLWDREAYTTRFHKVRALIEGGDAYQVNLTFPLAFKFSGSRRALFGDLRRSARAGHSAFLALDGLSILSLSPELFLRMDGDALEARPMKGTAKRGPTIEADNAIRHALYADPKNRAENLMIVDLMRNDLGRVAQTGSVRTDALFAVETYPTLHQMTSTIRAKAQSGTTLGELLPALFPAGSVTGAPKIRAMEIIAALESEPRGLYCGSIGALTPDGLSLNVAIRTLTIDDQGQGRVHIGSGLVADSRADSEYDECLLKAGFISRDAAPFSLIETLRWSSNDRYDLLDEHLERLRRSADYFLFPFREAEIRAALHDAAQSFPTSSRRVRLTLSEEGAIAVTHAALDPIKPPLRVILSARRVDRADPFFYHKTTRRGFYDSELQRLRTPSGADEVIFVNQDGAVTEGTRTNLFIQRGELLLTPPLSCGLLAGTLRARLLAEGKAREHLIAPGDLADATPLFLGNSVRGLMPALYCGREADYASRFPLITGST